uniref:F-box protein AT5G49610-like beta-propeller domain-containing protein n=1 Tax=Aegilops tauschii TaxID=37682 RepID=M8BPR6_AEGTA
MACVLVGNCLYWVLIGESPRILELYLDRQSLTLIHMPVDMYNNNACHFSFMRVEGGVLCFLILSWDFNAQLWNMEKNCDGVVSWVLRTTIELDKLLSLKPDEVGPQLIIGFDEDNNVFFLSTKVGVFMVHLKSLQFKELSKTHHLSHYHPFESVYTAAFRVNVYVCVLVVYVIVLSWKIPASGI